VEVREFGAAQRLEITIPPRTRLPSFPRCRAARCRCARPHAVPHRRVEVRKLALNAAADGRLRRPVSARPRRRKAQGDAPV
jgi:hypothetical protein